jgi:hypothetical protein
MSTRPNEPERGRIPRAKDGAVAAWRSDAHLRTSRRGYWSPEVGAILAVLSTVACMAPATGILAAAAMLIGALTVNPTNDHLPAGGN